MSSYQLVGVVLLAGLLGAALWFSLRAFWEITVQVRELVGEKAERDRQLTVVLDEMDLRIRRLLARENYWRGMATKNTPLPDEPIEEEAPKETPLEARRRMRGY